MNNDQDTRIIYNDAYGLWTEDDQTRVAAEVLALIDAQGPAADGPKAEELSDQ
jgi:hypothetical protein